MWLAITLGAMALALGPGCLDFLLQKRPDRRESRLSRRRGFAARTLEQLDRLDVAMRKFLRDTKGKHDGQG